MADRVNARMSREEKNRMRQKEKRLKREEKERQKQASNLRAAQAVTKVGKFLRGWANFGQPDYFFLVVVLILMAWGLVSMFSASYTVAYYEENGDSLYYIRKQLIYMIPALIVLVAASLFNYKKLNTKIAPIIYCASVLLLCLTLVINHGKGSNFKRWIQIGPVGFQPSDIAKFAVVLFLAYNIAHQYGMIGSTKVPNLPSVQKFDRKITGWFRRSYKNASTMSMFLTVWYALLISVVCVLVFLENHLSGTILIFVLGVGMMWLGGVKKGYFVFLALIIVAAVALVVLDPELLKDYASERIVAWLDKEYDPLGARWQTNQSLIAIASGGPFGLGLGASRQKHMYVSEPQNDFVFSIFCEECGFIGAIALIILFAVLVWRGFKIGMQSDDVFGSMLAMGLSMHVGIQAILNIAVVTDAIPNTGISLPFFSSGGTSLIMLAGEMGLVLSVSRQARMKKS